MRSAVNSCLAAAASVGSMIALLRPSYYLKLTLASVEELEAALAAARAMKGPSVVDVAIDPRVVAPTLRSRTETLKSFFAGQAQRRP